MFMCGLADSEEYSQNSSNYDPLTYFKCMLLLNSNYVGKEIVYNYIDYGDYGDYSDYYDDYSNYYDDYYYEDYNDGGYLEATSLYVYESDVRDYFQLATEICYLGKV